MARADTDYKVSLEDEIANTLSAEIAAEIDFGILSELLCSLGWTRVTRDPHVTVEEATEIKQWLKQHCKGAVKSHGSTWVFENEKEASHFILRWVS